MKQSKQPIAFQIKSLNNQIRRLLEKSAFPENHAELTGMHYAVLGYLADQEEDVYQKDIEAEFNIRRSTASEMLKLMEKNGFLLRTYDTIDTRLKKITLTEKAKELDKIAKANILQLQQRMTEGISPEEMEQFYHVLQKISNNIKE